MVLTSAAEGEARPRPDLVHIELLEVDIAQVDVLEETTSGSEQHRHHVDAEFVGQARGEHGPNNGDPADDGDRPIPGGTGRLDDGRLEAVRYEREREVLALLRWDARRLVGQHEMGTWNSKVPTYESGSPISKARLPIRTAPVSRIIACM